MAVNGSVRKDRVEETEIPDDDDVDAADRRPSKRPVVAQKKRSRRLPIVAIGVVVVAAVAVVAVLLSSGSSAPKPKASPPKKVTFTTFSDKVAAFHLNYPSTWTVTQSADPNVPLQLNFGAGNLDTLLVRVVPLQSSVNLTNESDIKAFTDAVISGTPVVVLKQQSVTVNQLPGYYYLYTLPKDRLTNVTLVHSHFFVFPPHEMVALVFQTVEPDFAGLAPTFDQVVSSFQAGA